MPVAGARSRPQPVGDLAGGDLAREVFGPALGQGLFRDVGPDLGERLEERRRQPRPGLGAGDLVHLGDVAVRLRRGQRHLVRRTVALAQIGQDRSSTS